MVPVPRTFPAAAVHALVIAMALALGFSACGSDIEARPLELLLHPEDLPGMQLLVHSESESESAEGPSALVELQGPEFRVLQSVLVYQDREQALAALDGIRGDLVSSAGTEPGGLESSGVLQHTLGNEEAASLFFIERNGLVRLTVTGPRRDQILEDLAEIAREKLSNS